MELRCEEFDQKKNLDQQRELFRDAFPEVAGSSTDNYKWWFHNFPNKERQSYEYCSYIGDEMVGYYAAIPYRYKIGNEMTDVAMVCGVMTSSKHRGKGVFTQLGKFATNDMAMHLPFTTGYPIRKEVIPGHLKVGWKIAFKLPLYMKFLKSDALLKNKFAKLSILSPLINLFLWLYHLLTKTKVDRKYQAEIFNSIDEIVGYDEFVAEWIQTVPNALIKDRDFARWRYGRPKSEYKFIVIHNKAKMIGFAAYCSVVKEGVPSYCLLDLSVLPDNFACLGLMYNTLRKEAKINNIEAIMLMQSKHSAGQYKLVRNGFLKSPFTFALIIKNMTNQFSDEQLFKEENWHLMWVDSDDL